jgi:hypothetical protein
MIEHALLLHSSCYLLFSLQPIISTLNYLTRTGDEIVRIEGIFSGTMSFLFNTFSTPTGPSAMPFSKYAPRVHTLHYSPIRSTARGKEWAALCGTFCIENQDGHAAHFFLRAVLQSIFVW